jgi:hypothetical protein
MGNFLTTPFGSFLRVVAGLVLAALMTFLLNGKTFADLQWADFQLWVSVAVGSALPVLIAYVNPADSRFGKGSDPGT